MPEAPENGDSVKVTLDGTHLKVDARPARLVSMLRAGGGTGRGEPVVTAQREGGDSVTQAVPSGARQVTFQVHGPLTVEATPGSDFVALVAEGSRRVVVAFSGEVVVLPNGSDGDRFALGAHEALLVPGAGGEPRVVPVDDLSDEDQDEISALMESAALANLAPAGEGPGGSSTDDTGDVVTEPEPETAETAAPAAAPGATASAAPPVPPAMPGGGQKRNKKGKKGRSQPQTKKQPPLVPAASTAGAGVRKAGSTTAPAKKASSGTKKTAVSGKAVASAPVDDGGYEDTPSDRRFIIGAIVLAAVIAIVLAVFVLTDDSDEGTDVAADSTTTTEADDGTTTTRPPSTTTSAAAAATTAAPSTTAAPPTTAAPTTTVAPPPAGQYAIEPKSCVQNANNSITYTATITNQSTTAYDYTIRIVFRDDKNVSVATSDANVADLGAGRSVDFSATGTPNRDLANAGNCNVDRVDARPTTGR